MANGEVCFPYYKNGGVYKKRGLRNKRKAHWARIRQAELREKERKARAAERVERDWEDQFSNDYGNYN